MPIKSTQTNKYETCCFVQEGSGFGEAEVDPRGYKIMKSLDGHHFIEFPATLQTFGCMNRNQRRYDAQNLMSCINGDERIQTLLRQNKWRGELNHPNPECVGQRFTDQRMSIPDQKLCSHAIRKPKLEGDRLRAVIRTLPETENGRMATSDVVDMGAVPSFSARLFGTMIPNASASSPNMRVTKVITYDMVDFPSHRDADGDIKPAVLEFYDGSATFLKELAQYCVDRSEKMKVVCESFELTPDEIIGLTANGNVITETADARIVMKLEKDIRNEALNILMENRR